MTTGTMTIRSAGTTTLRENHVGSIVIGVSGALLNLNGFSVIGSDAPGSFGIRSQFDDTIVTNGRVTHHAVGIHVVGDHSTISRVTVTYSQTMGIGLSGDASIVHNAVVGSVWAPDDYTGVTAGIMMWGQNSNLVANNVFDIDSNWEAVGMGLIGWGNVLDCRIQGLGWEGREFGFWHSGDGVDVEDSWFHDLDHAVGASGYVRIRNSTMHSDDGWYGTGVIDCGGNVFTFGV